MNTYNMNQYQQNQVSTASPEQILLMLYDGAIRFTRRAISGVEENKPELKMSGVSKAMAIIAEFSNSLNHDIGGQIAEDLDALYHFMMRELTSANLKNDVEKLKNVETLLVDLRQTWAEAVVLSKKELNAAEISVNRSQESYTPLSVSR
jgi:flagellar protein FliS